jgi:hypothetical protein
MKEPKEILVRLEKLDIKVQQQEVDIMEIWEILAVQLV